MTADELRVHFLHEPEGEWRRYLRERLEPEVTVTFGADLPDPADYEVLVAGRPPGEALTASPRLRRLVIPWAGVPETTQALLEAFPDLVVHNLHHNSRFVAEMTLALLLAAAKFIVPMDGALRRHDWTPRYAPNPAIQLGGKTALILGYGAIGRRVAEMCRGLGMRIRAIRRRVRPEDDPEVVFPPEALHRWLPEATALIVALPHTAATEDLIGAEELAMLPRGAVLVNVARGPIVDEGPLYRALRDGTLHAAGLDVWYRYPSGKDAGYGVEEARSHTPPSAYPFHELDNVVMSPHRAGGLGTDAVEEARMEHLARLLNAIARDEPAPNRVDLDAGY